MFATRTTPDTVSRRREPYGGPLPRVLQDHRRALFRRGQDQAGGGNGQGENVAIVLLRTHSEHTRSLAASLLYLRKHYSCSNMIVWVSLFWIVVWIVLLFQYAQMYRKENERYSNPILACLLVILYRLALFFFELWLVARG